MKVRYHGEFKGATVVATPNSSRKPSMKFSWSLIRHFYDDEDDDDGDDDDDDDKTVTTTTMMK